MRPAHARSSSGFSIMWLKIWEKSNYETLKKVRYLSKAGNYEFRC